MSADPTKPVAGMRVRAKDGTKRVFLGSRRDPFGVWHALYSEGPDAYTCLMKSWQRWCRRKCAEVLPCD